MVVDLKRYQKLKDDVDRLRREADRAEGALEELMGRLEAEFGCKTLREAKALSSRLEDEADKATKEFNSKLDEFEEEWGEVLGRSS